MKTKCNMSTLLCLCASPSILLFAHHHRPQFASTPASVGSTFAQTNLATALNISTSAVEGAATGATDLSVSEGESDGNVPMSCV